MKTRYIVIIVAVLLVGFASAMWVTQPQTLTAQDEQSRSPSDYVNQWLRANSAASSDGYSLKVEFTPPDTLTKDFSTTSTVETIQTLTRTTSGTPANGIGGSLDLGAETAAGNNEVGLTLEAVTTDVTSTSEDFDAVIGLMDGGSAAAERWRLDSGGVITQSAESAATNSVVDIYSFKHGTSGTEANGIGLGLTFTQEVTSGDEIAANLDVVATDVTATSEDFSYIFSLMKAGAAASQVLEIQSTGVLELINAGTIDNTTNGIITVDEPSSATNTVVDIFKISHSTSGTAAAGIGTGLAFEGEDDGGAVQVGMTIDMLSTDVTATSEDYDAVIGLMDGGTAAAERWRVDSGGVVTQSANSAATNAVVDVMNVKHNTSGTAANGIGSGIIFTQETAAGNDEIGANIDVVATDVTDTSEDFSLIVSLMKAGAAATQALEILSTGVLELVNAATIDNSTDGTVIITEPTISLQGALDFKTCTIADGDATPDVSGCHVLTTSANTGATEITDLDNPVVGGIYIIIGGSATNSSTITDGGNFALSAGFTASVDETLTLFVQADNDYIELTRSTN